MITEANYPTDGKLLVHMRSLIVYLVSGDTMRYQVFGEGISPSGLRPSGDIPITSHLISQGISLNSTQYLVIIILILRKLSLAKTFE